MEVSLAQPPQEAAFHRTSFFLTLVKSYSLNYSAVTNLDGACDYDYC